jgi:membrane-bound lytic murein transglycosylase F
MLNRQGGIISRYDGLFRRYAPTIRWDWRLLAAQCYQESTFDPQARSWAGACGLMQIMPGTADHLGLARADLFHPEKNIEAAVRYLGELESNFSDIPQRSERTKFVLAAYNGGHYHIRDAMALARRDGRNALVWSEVEPYVLGLSQPAYYNDPVVKNGYMRGSETVDYVRKIHERWNGYRGVKSVRTATGPSGTPQKARRERKQKYQV